MTSQKLTVVVTGASRGIGLAVTRILLEKFGANVIAISRSLTTELEALRKTWDSCVPMQFDITQEKVFTSAIEMAIARFRGIDGLVLNAGILEACRIGDGTPLASWKRQFDVNFFSLITALKTTLPYLRQSKNGGRVVFVSSGSAVSGMAGWGPYNASKAAMNSLCRTLAEEEHDVTSVAVRPGKVDTEMQSIVRDLGSTHMKEDDHKMFVSAYEEGSLVKPEDCGHVIAALSLQAPKSLSGQFISWDSAECRDFRRD